jgi:hypothetical protein
MSTPGMTCNRRMFESVVVGYHTYVQTEEVFEQHRPIVAGDELHVDVELSSVRKTAGRDFITVTNTFTRRPCAPKARFGSPTAHDPHTGDAVLRRRSGRRRAACAPRTSVSRRPGELCRGGRRRQPDSLGRGHRQARRAARYDRPRDVDDGFGCRIRLRVVGRSRCGYPLRGPAVSARDRVGHRRRRRIQRPDQSLDPATRSGVVVVAAKSAGWKVFGMATVNVRFR